MFEDLITIKNCECGRDHSLTTKTFVVKRGAIAELPSVLEEYKIQGKVLCVYDTNTRKAAGDQVRQVLPASEEYVFEVKPGTLLHPLDSEIYPLRDYMKKNNISLAVSVGGGVITDVTRYAAYLSDVPFVSVPTCASVDGFVSNTCAVVLNGMKFSAPARSPIAVVADTDIIAAAPSFLAASGVGDMVAKYLAIAEWKIGFLTQNEYYCPKIAGCAIDATNEIVSNVEGIAKKEPEAISKLIEGLLLSSIAMQLATITRPASSFEHHFSHYLEIVPDTGVDDNALHGEKVGVGTLISQANYEAMIDALCSIPNGAKNIFSTEYAVSKFYDKPEFIKELVAKENESSTSFDLNTDLVSKNSKEIKQIEKEMPTYDDLLKVLQTVGAKTTYKDIGITKDMAHRVFSECCYIRNRYTTLRNINDYKVFDFKNLIIPEK